MLAMDGVLEILSICHHSHTAVPHRSWYRLWLAIPTWVCYRLWCSWESDFHYVNDSRGGLACPSLLWHRYYKSNYTSGSAISNNKFYSCRIDNKNNQNPGSDSNKFWRWAMILEFRLWFRKNENGPKVRLASLPRKSLVDWQD